MRAPSSFSRIECCKGSAWILQRFFFLFFNINLFIYLLIDTKNGAATLQVEAYFMSYSNYIITRYQKTKKTKNHISRNFTFSIVQESLTLLVSKTFFLTFLSSVQ